MKLAVSLLSLLAAVGCETPPCPKQQEAPEAGVAALRSQVDAATVHFEKEFSGSVFDLLVRCAEVLPVPLYLEGPLYQDLPDEFGSWTGDVPARVILEALAHVLPPVPDVLVEANRVVLKRSVGGKVLWGPACAVIDFGPKPRASLSLEFQECIGYSAVIVDVRVIKAVQDRPPVGLVGRVPRLKALRACLDSVMIRTRFVETDDALYVELV